MIISLCGTLLDFDEVWQGDFIDLLAGQICVFFHWDKKKKFSEAFAGDNTSESYGTDCQAIFFVG